VKRTLLRKMVHLKKTACTVIVLALALTLFFCFPKMALAGDKLIIPEWVVDAHLLETGDLQIVEDITFEFNDKFNGVFRDIVLERISGVSDIRVQEISGTDAREYMLVDDAEKGDHDVFIIKEEKDRIIIQIFSPSKEDQVKTFRISYVVEDVAVKYNDIGELYYKFVGDENETPIKNFKATIRLPHEDTDNKVRFFVHGVSDEIISKENSAAYFLFVEDVPSNAFIEARVLFPKEFIPLSKNIRDIDNYYNILEEEAEYKNRQIEARERRQKIGNLLEQASIVSSGLGLILFILFLVLFRREKTENIYRMDEYKGDYIPEDCTPAVAAYLTGSVISTNTIFATILDLFRKGYVKIDRNNHKKDGEDIKSEDETYVISRVKEEDDSLLSHEKHFINWLINEMGDGHSVTNKRIENFGKNNSSKFVTLFAEWKNKIKEDAVNKGYYDKSKAKYGAFFLIFSILQFILGVFTLVYDSLYGLAGLMVSAVLFVYSIVLFYWRSDYGYSMYKKWIKFKKYFRKYDIDLSKEDLINSLDASLIYALSLGVVKRMDDLDIDQYDYSDSVYSSNGWIFWYLLFISKDNTFQKSVNKSFGSVTGSYYGGGSSGGGFSGGGGAGGGGAGGF
jgi:uncharacterized membrane protein